jgi:hypothetical protein
MLRAPGSREPHEQDHIHFDSSPSAMSSGSSNVICMVLPVPSFRLSQEQLSLFRQRTGASSIGFCAKNSSNPQLPDASPLAPGSYRTPAAFREERVSRAADFRGAGAAFPTEGIVTKSNAS